MKVKSSMMKKWSLRITMTIAIIINILAAQANNTSETLIMSGYWTVSKSLTPNCPITVSVDDSFLYIQNELPDRDIVISIINEFTGETEYEKTIEKSQTAYVAVSVLNLTAGEYKIEITGFPIGFLEGKFIKH